MDEFLSYVRKNELLDNLCSELADDGRHLDTHTLRDALGSLLLAISHGQATLREFDSQRFETRFAKLLQISCVECSHRVERILQRLRDQKGETQAEDYLHASLRDAVPPRWICDLQVLRVRDLPRKEFHAVWDDSRKKFFDIQFLSTPKQPPARSPTWEFLSSLPGWKKPAAVRGPEAFCSEENLAAAEALGVDFVFRLPQATCLLDQGDARASSIQKTEAPICKIIKLSGWSRERRVLFLKSGAVVASQGLSLFAAETLLHGMASSRSWHMAPLGADSSDCLQTVALFAAIFQNWWSDFEAGRPLGGLSCSGRAAIPQRSRKISQKLAAVILILIATGIAFTANPQASERPPPPVQNAAESDAEFLLAPMEPLEPDAGFQTAEAITEYPIAPLPDPNVDDVPPLDGEQIGLVQVPEEADDRMWRIRPIVATGVTYDDNIFITNTDRKGDLIYNINLGFVLEVGDYRNMESNFLLLEYLAEGFFFNRYASQNSFDQQASLLAQYRFNQLAVQVESRYQYLNGAEREVGAFTTRSIYFNALRFLYQYSEKTDIDLEFNQSTNDYPSNLSSSDYQSSLAFDYALFPKTRAGLQAIAGLQRTEDSPDMWYQTINARVNYGVTGKVVVNASGGIQFNQYVTGGEPMRILPIFSLGAEYLLFPKTTLTIVGYRNLQSSPSIAGQDYIATGGELGISQGLTDKLTFAIASGYENDTYVANTADTDATRVDNFYFFRPSVSYSFLKYLRASLSYEYRANASNFQEDTWFDNQFSCAIEGDF